MLPKIKMVKKALQTLHTSTCIVYTYPNEEIDTQTGLVSSKVVTSEEYPCRISFKTATAGDRENGLGVAIHVATLFLSPDIEVVAGSDIDVIQNGRVYEYKASGVPLVFQSHQEIGLIERVKHHG